MIITLWSCYVGVITRGFRLTFLYYFSINLEEILKKKGIDKQKIYIFINLYNQKTLKHLKNSNMKENITP